MGWFEGDLASPLTLVGELQGWNEDGTPVLAPLQVSEVQEAEPVVTPAPPVLSATQPSRTSIALTWTPGSTVGRPVVTGWEVQRRSSTDNGATFGAWAAISGSPFTAGTTTRTDSSLPTGTPEVIFEHRARATSNAGPSEWSNVTRRQWAATVVQPPTAPTSFTQTGSTTTSRSFSWAETADSTVTKHGLFRNGVLVVDGIDRAAKTFTWTGLTAGQTYSGVGVARFNTGGWSPVSNTISFTQPNEATPTDPEPVPAGTMLMGCSTSNNAHGGTEVWDGWRSYRRDEFYAYANRTGSQRPKFMAYSEQGENLSGGYTAVYNHCLDELNTFYYGGTGQTRSARWGIKLFWSNGNENFDKGDLSLPHTSAGIAAFTASMRGLYDAVHYIDPATGQRRFPDAYSGSNPTQNAEQSGLVADYLHPSARYHDFVMWSMYPPGRQTTPDDPTFNWPSLREADRTDLRLGYLIRCFYRTAQARAQARIDTGQPNRNIAIGCGEVGIGNDPGDSTTRPYYTAHALAGGMAKLSAQYNMPMPFACWWDNQSSSTSPQNILTDEQAGTSPSTRVAWQTWRSLNHEFGGTHPSSWANNPKAGWKTTGPVV